ncbi:hypothetical protein ACIF8T_18305 [Streptomyces sp. NPDC085946]|uniref:hypothetical protein n=1 Tax=Streptomyces sp. NPDC085946 TaxID=3365744 RepID=UPI0037D51581
MAGSSSGIVAALTAAALGTVGHLACQAAASAPAGPGEPRAGSSPSAVAPPAPRHRADPATPPAGSGSGARVVYALGDDRVWLVGAGERVRRTFVVYPSAVDPAPGRYTVTSRSKAVTGSDGTPVEHVVRFTSVDGVSVGFSAAVDGSTPRPDPGVRTGGIRETRPDGDAMWSFATIGRRVVVVR